tara:strand:- start:171 stop:404 length:234 start_codon:yes stop_codon:yes gene_type:complete
MERPEVERVEMANKLLAESLALSVVKMDRFIDVGLNHRGDETRVLELFVFTREEMNQFMESVAESTAQYLMGGSKRN